MRERSKKLDTEPQQYATFETVKHKRKKLWSKDVKSTAATDLKECISFHSLDGGGFLSVYKKSEQGYLLSDIKDVSHSEFVEVFAQAAYKAVKMYISIGNVSDFAIITTPRRRHSEGFHFASAVCERLQDLTRIRYYDDIVAAKNKSRLEPDFELVEVPNEHTIILYDDILTTGTTIRATRQLLLNANKNVITIIGVLNR